jgi:hypothetical protein
MRALEDMQYNPDNYINKYKKPYNDFLKHALIQFISIDMRKLDLRQLRDVREYVKNIK